MKTKNIGRDLSPAQEGASADPIPEVNLALVPKGGDTIPEGQSVKCVGNEVDVFRWMEGHLHRYPDPPVASSWDDQWRSKAVTLDCTSLMLAYGSPMKMFLNEGDSVVCLDGDMDMVFRWTKGKLRHYPDTTAASSWDPNWRDTTAIDCSTLTHGHAMIEKFFLEEGDNVMCHGDEYRVYRWMNGQLRHFPNPSVANSWDENWRPHIQRIDCSPYEIVQAMSDKPDIVVDNLRALFKIGRNTFGRDAIDLIVQENTDPYQNEGQVKISLSTQRDITWGKGIFCGAVGGWEMLGTVGDRHGPMTGYFKQHVLDDAFLCKVEDGYHKCVYGVTVEGVGKELDPKFEYHFRWVKDDL